MLLGAGAALLAPGGALAAPAAAGLDLQPLPPAPARPIVEDGFCWITGVDRSARGVAIHFSGRRQVTIRTPDGRMDRHTYDPALLPDWQNRKAAPANAAADSPADARRAIFSAEGPILHLGDGASFSMHNSPSDSCSGKVMRDAEGRIGVMMTASVRIDWATPEPFTNTKEKFVLAQPADAIVREKTAPGYGYYIEWPRRVEAIPSLTRMFEELAETSERELKRLVDAQGADSQPPEPVSIVTITRMAGDDGRLLSLLTEGQFHFGGAHPVPGQSAVLWDRANHAEISAASLFSDGMAGLRAPYCTGLDAERAGRGDWVPGSEEKYLGLYDCPGFDLLSVAPIGDPGQPFDRIRIVAAPYVAGPYSDGYYVVTFPVTADMMRLIKDEYRSSFRPYAARP